MTDKGTASPSVWRGLSCAVLLLSGAFGASGCSSVPDAVNPVDWYRGVESWFESDEDQQNRTAERTARETAPPLPGADKDYPNLSTVPDRPRSVSTSAERNRIERGLAADRENARYAEPEPGRPAGDEVGAPIAAPRTPVTRQPAPARPQGAAPNSRESMPVDPQPMPSGVLPDQRSSLEEPAPATPATAQADEPSAGASASLQAAATPRPAAPAVTRAAESAAAKMASAPRPEPADAMVQPASLSAPTDTVSPPVGNWPTRSTENLPSFLILFSAGSAQVDRADREMLREVLRIYKNRGGPVKIIGHASADNRNPNSVQRQLANFRVSSQRAESVARELAGLGVARADMIVGAVSDSEPIYGESSAAGVAGNRRVEVVFIP